MSMCSMCSSRFVRYVRCSKAGNGMYDLVWCDTVCSGARCDVSLDLCLFLVPFAFFMLRSLVCTMHIMKRYWILKPDKGF